MNRARLICSLLLVALILPTTVYAGTSCLDPGDLEDFRYTWRLRSGIAWLVRLAFPTSGTAYPKSSRDREDGRIESELYLTAPNRDDYYRYESQIDPHAEKTMSTYHAYVWGSKESHDRTRFDYTENLAHRRKEKADGVEVRVQEIPNGALMDILTGIYYVRSHADEIVKPTPGRIYADGKFYAIVFKPVGTEVIRANGESMTSRCFEIEAPDKRERWLRVCLSDDARHVPVQIDIRRGSLAKFELVLESIESCGPATPASQSGKR